MAAVHKFDFCLIAILLIIVPLSYIHQIAPASDLFIYHLVSKATLGVILIIWFITCPRWYYGYIAIPLSMIIGQLCCQIVDGKLVAYSHAYHFLLALPLLYPIYRLRKHYWRIACKDHLERTTHRESFIQALNTLRGSDQTGAQGGRRSESHPRQALGILKEPRAKGDYIVVFILLFSAPLSYAYLLFSDIDPLRLIRWGGFRDIGWWGYHFFQKANSVLLVSAWFFSSRQWWWHIIAWPLLMYCFQMVSLISVKTGLNDENKTLYLIALALVLSYPLYRARRYIYWDIFHEDWEKNTLSTREIARHVARSLTDFIFSCLILYLIQKTFFERPILFGGPRSSNNPVIFQEVFTALMFAWFLSAKDWWFFLLLFPLLFCLFNTMGSLGILETMDIEKNELYYLLPILALAFYPLYRLRHYTFEEIYKRDVEKERYIEGKRMAVELLERRKKEVARSF